MLIIEKRVFHLADRDKYKSGVTGIRVIIYLKRIILYQFMLAFHLLNLYNYARCASYANAAITITLAFSR
jgi:hypothetical protein